MSESPKQNQHLLIVDDDELTREVLTVVAEEAGCSVVACASGEEALAHIALGTPVNVLLADMHMPGLCGGALAQRLRPRCAPGTVLVAMSASPIPPEERADYDSFLRKPFQFHQLVAVLQAAPVTQHVGSAPTEILDARTYAALAGSMPPSTVKAMYEMCLADAEKRTLLMLAAAAQGDAVSFRSAAHAIKGGCGMVGALELAAWADGWERNGLPPVDDFDPAGYFASAAERLRSMLKAQTEQYALSPAAHGR